MSYTTVLTSPDEPEHRRRLRRLSPAEAARLVAAARTDTATDWRVQVYHRPSVCPAAATGACTCARGRR